MTTIRLSACAAALVLLAGCQDNKEAPATNEPSEAPTPAAVTPTTDAPPPAISDPASPSPVGTDVGASASDATATTLPGDSTQARAAHP